MTIKFDHAVELIKFVSGDVLRSWGEGAGVPCIAIDLHDHYLNFPVVNRYRSSIKGQRKDM